MVFYRDKWDSGNPGYWWFFLGLLDLDGFFYWTYFVCWYKDVEESDERESFSTEGGKCTTNVSVPAAHVKKHGENGDTEGTEIFSLELYFPPCPPLFRFPPC